MHQVLVYGDSLSWGIVPNTRLRLPFHQRWPGVAEAKLNGAGLHARMIEDCLNGRRTIWEDPLKAGRNGLVGLAQRMEVNSPLSLVVLMLGTNDFQWCHPQNDAWAAAQGVATLVNAIRTAPIEPGMAVPEILVVAPPQIQNPCGAIAAKFRGAGERSAGLAEAYRQMAEEQRCHFFDAQTVTSVSPLDGVHLEAVQHQVLGEALAKVLQPLLVDTPTPR